MFRFVHIFVLFMLHEQFCIMNVDERDLLYFAFQKLEGLIGSKMKDLSLISTNGHPNWNEYQDGTIQLKLGETKVKFHVMVKNQLRDHLPGYLSQLGKDGLLVCRYITTPMKMQLKQKGINYLDAAGNCFIKVDPIFVYINDQPVTDVRLPVDGKLWKVNGIKFLFSILVNTALVNESYRKIASIAGIALGSVGPIMEELKKEGFLKEGKKDGKIFLFIEGKEQLMRRWAEAYRGTLRPRIHRYNYRFVNKETALNWQNIRTDDFQWGGEPGGAILTDHLVPEKMTIYTDQIRTKIIQKLRLIPDENGNVEILEKFWSADEYEFQGQNTVPPLLIYADLITTIDSRNQHIAERVK
ncbi:MAG: hypothetical protein EOO20_22565, partial [Chryseobacterium sp.]